MYTFLYILLVICGVINLKPCNSMAKTNADAYRFTNLNSILLNCPSNRNRFCEPQLIINIDFTPNLMPQTCDSLIILYEAYEPTKRQNLKLMSPYIIVISRIQPVTVQPNLPSKGTNLNNKSNSLSINRCNEGKMENGSTLHHEAKKIKGKESLTNISTADRQHTNDKQRSRFTTNAKERKTIYRFKGYYDKCKKNSMNERKTGQLICNNNNKRNLETTKNSFLRKKCDTRAYSAQNLKVNVPYFAAKLRIFRKRKKTWWMTVPSIVLNNLSGTFDSGNLSILLTSHENILKTRKSLFLGNQSFLIPLNFLNNSQNFNELYNNLMNTNTFDYSNKFKMNDKLKRKLSFNNKINKNLENGINIFSGVGLIPTSINKLAKGPANKKMLRLNIFDNQIPPFSIKIKMPFRENAPQQNVLKVKVSRIVTDATTKDALQISVDVINKGLQAHEFFISIINCPLAETESTSTTVKKMLLPYISVTITFLLPFIMGSKKNLKYNCELVVKASTFGTAKEIPPNKSTSSESNNLVISRRSFEIETHSRCFCVWNCRCHCIGKLENHIDVSACQKMSYSKEKDAGILLNCPPNEDALEICSVDLDNDNKDIHAAFAFFCKIAVITIILTIIFFLVLLKLKSLIKYEQCMLIMPQVHFINFLVVSVVIILTLLFYWMFFIPLNWTQHINNISDWKILSTKQNWRCKSNRAAINRLKKARVMGSNKLPPPYPNGWYGILESSKLKPGESTHISCLGEQFLVFRSQKKEVFILDAYCPHLGANLGIGGRVVGDNIECPFHKWSFRGTDGTCANIPYSTCVPPSAKIKKWTSSEVNGFIFVWYSVEVSDLPWDIPKSFDVQTNKLVYHGRNEFYVHCHIQEIPENGADIAHFGAIHNDNIIAGCINKKPSILRTLGNHQWKASWNVSADKHIAETKLNHTFILFGKFQCFRMNVIGKQIGPSYVHLFLHSPIFGNFQIFQTITPVEPLLQKVVHRFYATRLLAPIMKFIIYGETIMFERDMNIWNHKIYRSNPLLVLEESSLKKFRKWYAQFYTVNSKSFQLSNNMNW